MGHRATIYYYQRADGSWHWVYQTINGRSLAESVGPFASEKLVRASAERFKEHLIVGAPVSRDRRLQTARA